jgi:hypothetical protein
MELRFSTISCRVMKIDVQPFHRNTNATITYFVFSDIDSTSARKACLGTQYHKSMVTSSASAE